MKLETAVTMACLVATEFKQTEIRRLHNKQKTPGKQTEIHQVWIHV